MEEYRYRQGVKALHEPPPVIGLEVEAYLKSFVKIHTGEDCDLHLVRDIQIRHASRKGHVMMAVLWAKVLQHELNYPQTKFVYTQGYDETSGSDVLIVSVDDVQLMVYMATGTLRIVGYCVYEWFAKKFRSLIENYDPVFAAQWGDEVMKDSCHAQSPVKDDSSGLRRKRIERRTMKDYRTATEEYLLLLTNKHTHHNGHDIRILHDTRHVDIELSNLKLCQQNLWKGPDLLYQIEHLGHGGVKDGYNYLYKLWRSLLSCWFSTPKTRVFICSPCLDQRSLSDILDLFLPHYTKAEIVSIFTQRKCRPDDSNHNSFFEMKRKLLKKYPERSHPFIEYKVYQTLLYPKKFNCRFIAGIRNGVVDIMVTSADFTMDHFVSGNMEFVSVLNMPEDVFMRDYIIPLTDQAVQLD